MCKKEENLRMLEQFQVTKAWGIKKYPTAMQFIYDEADRWFAVAEGPVDTFREREPAVPRFGQVALFSCAGKRLQSAPVLVE